MHVYTLPAFTDNYFWLLVENKQAWVVDPGDAQVVESALLHYQLELVGILVTHHHSDHTGGLDALCRQHKLTVCAPGNDPIKKISIDTSKINKINVLGYNCEVISTPGHTAGHVSYYFPESSALFCGDTLFAGGCGRLFEGTPDELFNSLLTLARLPADTLIYCAHEYTLANLKFASGVEPKNLALQKRLEETKDLRSQALSTIPSTLSLELSTNPFLRCHHADVRQAVENYMGGSLLTPLEVFTHLRRWKDGFR